MPASVDASPPPIELRLSARPESAAHARHALGEYAERLGADVAAVRSAVSEAVTNAVLHAYHPEQGGEIIVHASATSDRMIVTVTDRGQGIRPDAANAGLGLGLPIIGELADELRVDSGRGTRVEMRFRI